MKKTNTYLLFILAIAIFYSCEDFQDEDYLIADVDQEACTLLQNFTVDSNFVEVTPTATIDSTLGSIADTIAVLDSVDQVFFVRTDSVWSFDVAAAGDTILYLFDNSTGGTEIIFFFDRYSNTDLHVSLYDLDGLPVAANDYSIAMETVAGCDQVKTRLEYTLSAEKYIVWFTCDAAALKNFNAVVLNEG